MTDDTCDQEPMSEEPIESTVNTKGLSVTVMLEAIGHHQRRETLRFLMDHSDATATIDNVAKHLSRREIEQTGNPSGSSPTEIKISLYHMHLPKLEEAGLIEYDQRSGELRYWRHAALEDILDCLPTDGNR